MVDIVLVSPPLPDIEALYDPYPPAGITTIHASVKRAGFTSRLLDLNMDFAKHHENPANRKALLSNEELTEDTYIICKRYVKQILSFDPIWVGFSILFEAQVKSAIELSKLLKRYNPDIKIVVGGTAVGGSLPDHLSKLKQDNIIDHYIVGPGEDTLVNLMQGQELIPGVDTNPPIFKRDLSRLPFRDFDGLYLKDYKNNQFIQHGDNEISPILFPLTYSEGCVYRCSFCNVAEFSPAYLYKNPKQVANEMLHLSNKYGAKLFRFTDGLINASVPKFRELLQSIIAARNTLPDEKKFKWLANFVTKSKDKLIASDYDLMKEAGCFELWSGIESGSAKVRSDMNMSFNNDDIKFTIEQTARVSITFGSNLIFGYMTETEDDFKQTLDFLEEFASYDNTILRTAGSMLVLRNAPIRKDAVLHGLDVNIKGFTARNWSTTLNPNNTPYTRAIRGIRLFYKIHKLGIHLHQYGTSFNRVRKQYQMLENSINVPDDIHIVDLYNIVKENHSFE